MKGWLLDANVISELRKKNCHPAVKAWADLQCPTSFYLGTITIGEISFRIEKTENKVFCQQLNQWLAVATRNHKGVGPEASVWEQIKWNYRESKGSKEKEPFLYSNYGN